MTDYCLDHHLAQADAAAIADGEADALLGCWLCGDYVEELPDGFNCPECAGVPGVSEIAQIYRRCEAILEGIEYTETHVRRMKGVKEALQLTLEAIEKENET